MPLTVTKGSSSRSCSPWREPSSLRGILHLQPVPVFGTLTVPVRTLSWCIGMGRAKPQQDTGLTVSWGWVGQKLVHNWSKNRKRGEILKSGFQWAELTAVHHSRKLRGVSPVTLICWETHWLEKQNQPELDLQTCAYAVWPFFSPG